MPCIEPDLLTSYLMFLRKTFNTSLVFFSSITVFSLREQAPVPRVLVAHLQYTFNYSKAANSRKTLQLSGSTTLNARHFTAHLPVPIVLSASRQRTFLHKRNVIHHWAISIRKRVLERSEQVVEAPGDNHVVIYTHKE